MQYEASKNVLPSVWEHTAGGRKLARKCSASFLVGNGALRMFFGLQSSKLLLVNVKMPIGSLVAGNFKHMDLVLL